VGLKKIVQKILLDLLTIGGNLLVSALARGSYRCQFKTVESTLASQWLALISLRKPVLTRWLAFAHHHRQQGIVTELIVIVEVFVAQRQA